MTQTATTKEQARKLIELGIDVNTADMYYYNNDSIPQIISDVKSLRENINPKFYTLAWSLSALIELMPEHIVINNKVSNSLKMYKEEGGIGFCYFFGAVDKVDDIIICDTTPLDAAYEMVVYLVENKLIQ